MLINKNRQTIIRSYRFRKPCMLLYYIFGYIFNLREHNINVLLPAFAFRRLHYYW